MMIGKMDALPAEIILPHGMLPMDSSTIIPMTSQTRMLAPRTQSVTIMELGKRLLQSAKEGNADEVKELMSKGAPFSTDWLGTSPLHLAAMGNHLKTCQILLRAGISKDARTKVERTPLHISAYEGHKDIVQLLLSNGADVNVKDMLKMTPLHWAVQNEHNECIRLLLMHGAQTEVVNKFDKTPMSMALEQKRMDFVEMLHEAQQMEFEREQNVELEQATLVAASQCMAEDINVSPMKNDKSERYDNHLEPPDPMENIRILEDNQNEDDDIIAHENSDENIMAENVLSEHEHEDPMQMFNTSSISISNNTIEANVKKMPNILSDTKKFSTKTLTPYKIKGSKVFTLSTDQFLALTGKMPNLLKKVIPLNQNNTSTKPLKRIVMTKDKIMVTPKLLTQNFVKIDTIDTVMDQLTEAKKVANDLREKLRQKEQEIDRYEKLLHKLQALKK